MGYSSTVYPHSVWAEQLSMARSQVCPRRWPGWRGGSKGLLLPAFPSLFSLPSLIPSSFFLRLSPYSLEPQRPLLSSHCIASCPLAS